MIASIAPWSREQTKNGGCDLNLLPNSSRSREQYSFPTGDCARLDAAVPQVPHEDVALRGRSELRHRSQQPSDEGARHGKCNTEMVDAANAEFGAPLHDEKECLRPARNCV